MTEQRTIDVLTVGGVDVDLILTVDSLPGPDEKVIGGYIGTMPGGPAANFACAAARLGVRVTALAEVGSDLHGQMVIDDFNSYQVDTSLIQVRPGAETTFTVILIPPSGEKVIIVAPTFEAQYDLDVVTQALQRAKLLYLMPQNHTLFYQLAPMAHAAGAEVMVDIERTVGDDRAAMRRLLAHVDIASFNQFGFAATTGEAPSVAAAAQLLDAGPHTVLVTIGAEGVLAVTRDEQVFVPGYPVTAVDTTGAGDTFNAAFVSGLVRGVPLAERLRFANAAGAISVTGMGPRGRLPTRDEVEAFLANA